jgi:membrane protease YdiL (CAAX protease family)
VALDQQPAPEGENEGEGQPPQDVRWGMGDALLGTALTLVLPAAVGGIVLAIAGWQETDDIPLWAVALLQIPLWAGLLGVPLLASRRKGRGTLAADFGLRMRWSDIPLGIGVGFGAQVVLGIIITNLYDALGIDTDKVGESAKQLTDQANDVVGVVLLVLIVAIAAPVFEELFYRGLWLRSVERRWGTPAGIAISSLLFGAVHFEPFDFPALVGFAVVVAILAVRTGRLGPSIWAHVVFNLTAVLNLLL